MFLRIAFVGLSASWATTAACAELTPDWSRWVPLLGLRTEGRLEQASTPPLTWKIQGAPIDPATRAHRVQWQLSGEGFTLAGSIDLNPHSLTGHWKIHPGHLDLRRWLRPLAQWTKLADGLGDLTGDGTLEIEGEGDFDHGRPSGRIQLHLRDGSVHSPAKNLSLRGVDLAISIDDLVEISSSAPQTLTFREIIWSGATATDGRAVFTLPGHGVIQLEEARLRIFDGTVAIPAATLDTRAPATQVVQATVKVDQLDLAKIAPLLPESVTEARGRLTGEIGVRWSAADGFKPGDGNLRIERLAGAEIRLTPRPGFLSGSVPPRIQLLPAWTGPLARWFSADNPVYDAVHDIEMGRMPLKLDHLQISLRPDGDRQGHTASVSLSARPSQAAAVEEVTFEVNVSGPLDHVIQLGLAKQLRVSTRP